MNSPRPDVKSTPRRQWRRFDLLNWVDSLVYLEQWARYLFLLLAGLSLCAYSYMVYTQEQWQGQHRQLQRLKQQESQQAIINARLRNQAAEQAETSPTMADPHPGRVVFVPANDRPPTLASSPPSPAIEHPLSKPIGY